MRARKVFRLIVSYPETPTLPDDYERGIPFTWPLKRDYLSAKGAQNRAHLFRRYGATVEIIESQPVTWAPQPMNFEGQHWLFENPLAS